MISISTIRTYMFCPLKLYFQYNLDEEMNEEFLISKAIKDLRIDIQDIFQRNIKRLKKEMSIEEIEKIMYIQVEEYIETNFKVLEDIEDMKNEEELEKVLKSKKELIEDTKLKTKILSIKAKKSMMSLNKNGEEIHGIFFPSCMYNYLIRDNSLDLVGSIDKIEIMKGIYYPISLKSSNPPIKGVWDNDLIEIAASALLIEQEFNTQVYVGFIEYLKIDQRRPVIIDTELRKSFFRILTEINKIMQNKYIPQVKTNLNKCRNCEYKELCEKN